MFSGSKLGSPDTSGVTRRQSRVCFRDCKGILTPILRTCVQKSTLLLQNRGHAEVLKKTPSSAKYVTKVRPPSVPECPPPPPRVDSRVGSGILAWTTDEKRYFGNMISSARYVSLLEQTNTPTYTHACKHAQIHTTPHQFIKGHWFIPQFTITCVRLRSHAIVVMKVFP